MDKKYITVNIGSSSKRYGFYEMDNLIISFHFEHDDNRSFLTINNNAREMISSHTFEYAFLTFFNKLKELSHLSNDKDISGIGVRVVAPGEYFSHHRIIDSMFIRKLIETEESDIAHISPVIKELKYIREVLPTVKVISASDSAFHNTMPEFVKNYAIPKDIAVKANVYRFGFHGLSIGSIVNYLKKQNNKIDSRIIVCHLGNGASVTALLNGKSIDTSMGYSPLDGLVMSSRVGNIDVGAIIKLGSIKSLNELQNIFYKESGLLALSGVSYDMRTLLEKEKQGHKGACMAIEKFIYDVKRYIGSYTAVLGGLDTLVFSGAIGENASSIRERICKGFVESIKPNVYVIKTQESDEIARILKENL
jgi:acetate kinase